MQPKVFELIHDSSQGCPKCLGPNASR